MPLPGGESDKFGNRYERRWTVYCMIDIMDEQAESIRLEPPGEEGEGVEFWLQREDLREYHQVKRQQSRQKGWTNAVLNSRRVLPHFFNKLSNKTDAHCVFVSIDRAFQFIFSIAFSVYGEAPAKHLDN
ncbi:MAG: hypothetical protein GY845_06815 [Planctomycetes bacterium]|nr:hypothetical protein [Planctomycetota bacterium]